MRVHAYVCAFVYVCGWKEGRKGRKEGNNCLCVFFFFVRTGLFESVKAQVFDLMEKDSFGRFRQSSLFHQLREHFITNGWIDTSGGETLDSFQLPEGLITVLDPEEESQKALEKRQNMLKVKPEFVRQKKKDMRALHMITMAAQLNRQSIMALSHKSDLRSPVDVEPLVYPYLLPNQVLTCREGL